MRSTFRIFYNTTQFDTLDPLKRNLYPVWWDTIRVKAEFRKYPEARFVDFQFGASPMELCPKVGDGLR